MPAASPATLQVAQAAFANFTTGLAKGDWQPFLDRVSDDVTFWFPAGPFKGHNQGKDKLVAFLAAVPKVFAGGLTVAVVQITSSDTTVVFEVRSTGTMGGAPYENQAAIAFDIRDQQICAYREYLGVVFPLRQ